MAKSVEDLTIRDNFMFSAIMSDAEHCKKLLEIILETEIERVEVDYEKSFVHNPRYHGVRLDVYAKDKANTRYNVEMQVRSEPLEKRTRYYHDEIDMDLLPKGEKYADLPDTYVIFICNFDPIEDGEKYRYRIKTVIEEIPTRDYVDGRHTILLSTKGKNADEVPHELVEFLRYVEQDSPDGSYYSEDEFVVKLQAAVERAKKNLDLGGRYMRLEEMLMERETEGELRGRIEGELRGKIEFVICVLQKKGEVSPELQEQITAKTTKDNIEILFSKALQAETIEEFEKEL